MDGVEIEVVVVIVVVVVSIDCVEDPVFVLTSLTSVQLAVNIETKNHPIFTITPPNITFSG